jgi:hypothetical protein
MGGIKGMQTVPIYPRPFLMEDLGCLLHGVLEYKLAYVTIYDV